MDATLEVYREVNEAIEDIKENILPCVGGKSLVVAINALEKQIPKKIVRVKLRPTEWGSGFICLECEVEQTATEFFGYGKADKISHSVGAVVKNWIGGMKNEID